jgi:hypothetical protein
MHDHLDRTPRNGFTFAVRLAATTVAMTTAAVVGCVILAVVAIATTNPETLAIAAILAVLVAGGTANLLAWMLRR